MRIELTPEQERWRSTFRRFAEEVVRPGADAWDRAEELPAEVVRLAAREGFFGALVPVAHGGLGLDAITGGLLHEEVGRCCTSLRSLFTVNWMVEHALTRWGSEEQKARWLPRLAAGEAIAAFGLTEPNVGCDAKHPEMTAVPAGDDEWVLNGCKTWITAGEIADVVLVMAQAAEGPTAFLVETSAPGLSRSPIRGLLGMRASMLATLDFRDCRIPRTATVGKPGFGFSHVAGAGLDLGRYTVAWGCVGIAQACLEASLAYSASRRQFGVPLNQHQLVQQMLADMIAGVTASRLVCLQAGYLRDTSHPRALMETTIAKYLASTTVARVANDAVQIHGARGCSSESPVQRYFRDARIMEIIEGSSQMQQIMIARFGARA
jgi:glutaryl-CoA dehydrogenase (non-decarboxylating)